MKKIKSLAMKGYIIALVLVLALSLLSACGGNNGNSNNNSTNPPVSKGGDNTQNNNNGGETGTLTASITSASGWVKDENSPYPVYKKDGVSFTLHPPKPAIGFPTEINTDNAKDIAEYLLGTLKENSTYKDATFSDVTKTTVNGMEAYEYTVIYFTTVRTIYICKDKTAYSIALSYLEDDEYNAVKDDIQSMLDSYTLK